MQSKFKILLVLILIFNINSFSQGLNELYKGVKLIGEGVSCIDTIKANYPIVYINKTEQEKGYYRQSSEGEKVHIRPYVFNDYESKIECLFCENILYKIKRTYTINDSNKGYQKYDSIKNILLVDFPHITEIDMYMENENIKDYFGKDAIFHKNGSDFSSQKTIFCSLWIELQPSGEYKLVTEYNNLLIVPLTQMNY
jgi:hypothetical protein